MLEGLSIPHYAKRFSGRKRFERARLQPCRKQAARVTTGWVQITSRKDRQDIKRARKREGCGKARLQPCRKGGKIDGALAPEVSPPSCRNPQRLQARFQL